MNLEVYKFIGWFNDWYKVVVKEVEILERFDEEFVKRVVFDIC